MFFVAATKTPANRMSHLTAQFVDRALALAMSRRLARAALARMTCSRRRLLFVVPPWTLRAMPKSDALVPARRAQLTSLATVCNAAVQRANVTISSIVRMDAARTTPSRTATTAAARPANARFKPSALDRVRLAQVIHRGAPALPVVSNRRAIRLVRCGKPATAVAAVRLDFAPSQTARFASQPTANAISTTRVTVRARPAQKGTARRATSATPRATTVANNKRAPVRPPHALPARCVPARTSVVRSRAAVVTSPIAATVSRTTVPTSSSRAATSVAPM